MKKLIIAILAVSTLGAFAVDYTPAKYEGTTTAIAGSNDVTVVEVGNVIRQSVLTVDDVSLTIDGSSGAGWGTAQIGVFPEGRIIVLGVTVDGMTITPDGEDLDSDGEGDFALGTTGTSDSTIDGTDVNLCPSTSMVSVTNVVNSALAADMQADGTTTPVPIYANFIMDDDDVAALSTNTFDAVVTISYVNLGDY